MYKIRLYRNCADILHQWCISLEGKEGVVLPIARMSILMVRTYETVNYVPAQLFRNQLTSLLRINLPVQHASTMIVIHVPQ